MDSAKSPNRGPWLATPLDCTRSYIRVLKLQRGRSGEKIMCDLYVVDLDERPHYEVLSYVWGDAQITDEITVGGVSFQATRNLIDFLQCLRLPDQDRVLWADAICIDQSNEKEKSFQIGMMTDIYRKATEAHIWFGPFNKDTWYADISGRQDFRLCSEFDLIDWKSYKKGCMQDLHYFTNQDGFKPMGMEDLEVFKARCESDIFTTTLDTLDTMTKDDHLYTYPIFCYAENEHGDFEYQINEYWLQVMDCILWLLCRQWWSRIWTLQEAVLPSVEPQVHAPPYTFNLSRLMNGLQSMFKHNNERCCKWFGGPVVTFARFRSSDIFSQSREVLKQRKELAAQTEGAGVPLNLIINAVQTRKATEIRDHWYGLFGFLPAKWQALDKASRCNPTPSELFSKFTKLLYAESGDLTHLDLACRTKTSNTPGLPSWAIDLTSSRQDNETDFNRWKLYDAAPKLPSESLITWSNLTERCFEVRAVRIASVQAIADRILPSEYDSSDILRLVQDWQAFYCMNAVPVEDNAFWRALFMDANVQLHWMSRRRGSLTVQRVGDIKKWFRSWSRTGDCRDLTYDRKSGNVERGWFHYRAVKRNVTKTRMFLTSQSLPGMGPFDTMVSDQIYAIKGCKALVVLRPVENADESSFSVVGLCFVDKWMYGRAAQGVIGHGGALNGRMEWAKLQLY